MSKHFDTQKLVKCTTTKNQTLSDDPDQILSHVDINQTNIRIKLNSLL